MKTIARNATRKIAAIRESATQTTVKELASNFEGHEVSIDSALEHLAMYDFARLIDNEDGTYTVRVHGNKWFTITTDTDDGRQ